METRNAKTYKKSCDNVLLKRGKSTSKMTELSLSDNGSVSFFKKAIKKVSVEY